MIRRIVACMLVIGCAGCQTQKQSLEIHASEVPELKFLNSVAHRACIQQYGELSVTTAAFALAKGQPRYVFGFNVSNRMEVEDARTCLLTCVKNIATDLLSHREIVEKTFHTMISPEAIVSQITIIMHVKSSRHSPVSRIIFENEKIFYDGTLSFEKGPERQFTENYLDAVTIWNALHADRKPREDV